MRLNSLLLLFTLVTTPYVTIVAQSYYAIHFTDKMPTQYALAGPGEFLSERSLQRKEAFGIPIDSADLPVPVVYIDSLEQLGYPTKFRSRWFNAAIIQSSATPTELRDLGFVNNLVYLGPDYNVPVEPNIEYQEPMDTTVLNTDQLNRLGIPDMHELGFRGSGVEIAVLDAGFRGVTPENPFFSHLFEEDRLRFKNFRDPDLSTSRYHSHGTQVAGVIAGRAPNSFQGVAPEATFHFIVTEIADAPSNYEYRLEEYLWLLAAEYCDSAGVDIINSSLGYNIFDDPSMTYDIEDLDGQSSVISRAAGIAFRKGMLVISSAGNEGANEWEKLVMPADGHGVIAVGSINEIGSLSGFSSRGPTADGRLKPDVLAIGDATITIDRDAEIITKRGTSFSAPFISGFAAGLWQAFPEWDHQEIRERIIRSGDRFMIPDNNYGHGVPDFGRALTGEVATPISSSSKRVIVWPNPVRDELFVENGGQDLMFNIRDTNGRLLLTRSGISVMPVSSLAAGTYFLEITGSGINQIERLVVLE